MRDVESVVAGLFAVDTICCQKMRGCCIEIGMNMRGNVIRENKSNC